MKLAQHRLGNLHCVALCLLLGTQACGSSKTAGKQDAGLANHGQSTGGSANTSAGSDGGIVSTVACSSNAECTPLNMVCDTFINLCVQCTGVNCKANTPLDSGACATSGGNPCSSMPRFTGTQTLDGKGDEFCLVAPAQLDSTNAGKVVVYNATPPEVLTARVAWSDAGIHAYFEVADASIQVVYTADATQAIDQAYQGDSVELMVSSSDSVTGLTGTDSNSLHVIIPASGPAISTKASNNNGTTQGAAVALPSTQYMQASTSSGYSIEVQLPWPGGSAPAPGSTIRFDLALNSADSTFGSVTDMRDGQLVYHLEAVDNSTCQGTDAPAPYCDDRTWCPATVAP